MNIQLKKLVLTNFKGIRNLSIDFDGDIDIYGANESGKSSIYTAFTWLLTGKDEFDRKDFEIKNTKNKDLNVQAHEVEGVFDVDGKELKLKRVFLEDWQKPKGQSRPVFKGHYTDFYYNDVPCNAKEFQAKIDAIIDPRYIKLVTNPIFFNTLHWESQRRGLIGIAGDITNDEVLDVITSAKNDYGTLTMALNGGKDLEEWKRELAAKKLLLKKAAVEFAPRIDEAMRNMPENKDWTAIEETIQITINSIAELETLILDASKAQTSKQKNLLDLQRRLHTKQTDLNNIRHKISQEIESGQNKVGSQANELKRQLADANNSLNRILKIDHDNGVSRQGLQQQIDNKNKIIETLRKEWDLINAENFQFDDAKCECPTCKQSLPKDQIESKKTELLKNFNDDVIRRKANKVAQSNQIKSEIAQLQENIAIIDQADNSPAGQIEQDRILAISTKLSELNSTSPLIAVDAVDALMATNADALSLRADITLLESEIKVETELFLNDPNIDEYKIDRQDLLTVLDNLKKEYANKEIIQKTQARIAQLQKEEEANAQTIATLEQQEFEIETFTRAKMDILEKKVNKLFKFVKFRLFETQVNGGIAETCVCEYEGVPYPTLNTAAKLLAGLDVLETLSNYYNIHAPVFCDNRESVSWIPETSSQIISLYVSAKDKKLRVTSKKASAMQTA